MNLRIASLVATLLLAACAPTTTAAGTSSSAPPPAPPVATTIPAVAGQIEGATFEAALAAAHLTPVQIPDLKREMTSDLSQERSKVEGRNVALIVTGGINADTIEFARAASGQLVRVLRQPDVTTKETVIEGCQQSAFAGGRAWFERVTFEVPAGLTWGGERTVKYPIVKETLRYTGKKPNGEACPPPNMIMD